MSCRYTAPRRAAEHCRSTPACRAARYPPARSRNPPDSFETRAQQRRTRAADMQPTSYKTSLPNPNRLRKKPSRLANGRPGGLSHNLLQHQLAAVQLDGFAHDITGGVRRHQPDDLGDLDRLAPLARRDSLDEIRNHLGGGKHLVERCIDHSRRNGVGAQTSPMPPLPTGKNPAVTEFVAYRNRHEAFRSEERRVGKE